jgi:outer membrane protein assembly factor BamB
MRRPIAALLAAVAALTLLVAPAAAAPFPSRIDLPNGWQPEGIAAGYGTTAYVGSLADGSIAKVNLRTGAVDAEFIEGPGLPAVGLFFDRDAGRLWVAGGPSGQVRVYDARTGVALATYQFTAGFVNDVVVTEDAAYATDSGVQQLLVVPLGDDGSLPAPADALALPITGDFVYEPGFNANGIESWNGRLLVPQSNTGELFAIDPGTGDSTQLLPSGAITAADGIRLVGATLYVVRNQLNQVDVYRLRGSTPVFVRSVHPDGVDVPTTIAFAAGRLWVANARFSTPPTPDTPYWITRVPRA